MLFSSRCPLQLLLLAMLGLQLVLLSTSGAPPASGYPQSKLVRINLEKKYLEQKGTLGQPLTSYYVLIDVGSPPKPFKMLLDMNAREIWLPHYSNVGLLLTRLNYKDGYRKKDSVTSAKEEEEFTIGYKTTEYTGKAYTDLFEFKNVTESLDFVKFNQRFLAISSASNSDFRRYDVDGVLAFSPWPISESGSEMISVSMTRAKLMKASEFQVGLALDRNPNSKYGGELTLGGFNPTKFLGALRFHELASQHLWDLNLNNVLLGRESIIDCVRLRCTAIISTTTDDIHGPPEAIRKVAQFFGYPNTAADGQKLYDVDCMRAASAPSIVFTIDDAEYVLPPASYIRERVEGRLFKNKVCYLTLISNGSTNKWELGTNFVSNFYAVFDVHKRRVALASRSTQ